MKAEITKNGLLKITAETELEMYAMNKWIDDNGKAVPENQLFVHGTDEPEFAVNAYRLNRVTDPKEKNPMNKPTDDSGNATIADSIRNSELKEPLGTIKKTVRVTIEKEIEIEIMPSMFGHMSEKDFLDEFNKYLWKIDGMDDVIKYAATAAATGGCGYTHDGIGLVDSYFSTYPRVPDVKVKELYEDIETEFVSCT